VTGANKGIGFAIVRGLCKQFKGDVYLTCKLQIILLIFILIVTFVCIVCVGDCLSVKTLQESFIGVHIIDDISNADIYYFDTCKICHFNAFHFQSLFELTSVEFSTHFVLIMTSIQLFYLGIFVLLHKATPVDKPQLSYLVNKLYKTLSYIKR